MKSATKIRCFDYVNRSYQKVCESLSKHSQVVFHLATRSAETRAESVAAGLHVNIAGVEIGKEIEIEVVSLEEVESNGERHFTVHLHWRASSAPQFFPTMDARLHIYPINSRETQLDLEGEYEPPFGFVGQALDAMVGHRIAEASVHQFLSEVANYLRKHL